MVVSSVAALREPLAVQVATRARPRRATTVAVFLSVLVIVGAGVAAYRSRAGTTEDPDALVLLGPALVGLAAGPGRDLAAAPRRPRRDRHDAAVAASRPSSPPAASPAPTTWSPRCASSWRPRWWPPSPRPAPRRSTTGPTPSRGSRRPDRRSSRSRAAPHSALALTRELDPEGDHLMATAVVPNLDRLGERRAYVDADRFEAVVGDFYDGTPVADAAAGRPRPRRRPARPRAAGRHPHRRRPGPREGRRLDAWAWASRSSTSATTTPGSPRPSVSR